MCLLEPAVWGVVEVLDYALWSRLLVRLRCAGAAGAASKRCFSSGVCVCVCWSWCVGVGVLEPLQSGVCTVSPRALLQTGRVLCAGCCWCGRGAVAKGPKGCLHFNNVGAATRCALWNWVAGVPVGGGSEMSMAVWALSPDGRKMVCLVDKTHPSYIRLGRFNTRVQHYADRRATTPTCS